MSFLFLGSVAVPFLVTLGLSVALSVAAYFLFQPKKPARPHGQTADDVPKNLAIQGAFVPLLVGRMRIGAVICWVGNREAKAERGPSPGKGLQWYPNSTSPTGRTLYFESAWHVLAVGPVGRIHKIWADGSIIFGEGAPPSVTTPPVGPTVPTPTVLDSINFPSGSVVTVGGASTTPGANQGSFTIFWGEDDQPINTFLGDSENVGISSRWPRVCYIVWNSFSLGFTPRWPFFEYEIEKYPETSPTGCDPVQEIISGDFDTDNTIFNSGVPLARVRKPEAATDTDNDFLGVLSIGTYDLSYRLDETEAGNNFSSLLNRFVNCMILQPEDDGDQSGYIDGIKVWIEDGTTATERVLYEKTDLGVFINPDDTINYPLPDCWQYVGRFGSENSHTFVRSFSRTVLEATTFDTYDVFATIDMDFAQTTEPPEADFWVYANLRELVPVTNAVLSSSPGLSTRGITQLLFNPYPYGMGFDFTEFDIGSLDLAISQLNGEGLQHVFYAQDGEEAGSLIGRFMQDAGLTWYRDYSQPGGVYAFKLARIDTSAATVPANIQVGGDFEIELLHGDAPVDRLLFSFPDKDRQYKETVIQIDADGQALLTNNVRGNITPIATVIDIAGASVAAERRSQEELGNNARYQVLTNRVATAQINPGTALVVENLPFVVRVAAVTVDPLTAEVLLDCILDNYGSSKATFEAPVEIPPNFGTGLVDAANLRETVIEVPEHLGLNGLTYLIALRIRAHIQIASNLVYFSADNVTYGNQDFDANSHQGGVLTQALPATGKWEVEQGPEFTAEGPDIADVLNLTGSEPSWRLGTQVAVINEEIFFLRNITAIGGDTYRLDGLIRARYDTIRESHGIGDAVFILPSSAVKPLSNIALVFPGASMFVKQQPGNFDLALVTPTAKSIKGKGITPMRPSGLRPTAPWLGVPGYETGDDISFKWSYRSSLTPKTGAGLQPAGDAVGFSNIRHEFEVVIKDPGLTIVRTQLLGTVTTFTYDNATLQADLGGETNFTIEIRNVNGGYKSDPISLLIEAL